MNTATSEFKDLIQVFRINVDVELWLTDKIAAAIQPLQLPDGTDDIKAIEEFEEFIINALGVFDAHDFVVLKEQESPYSNSWYYSLVKKDQYEAKQYKYILFIRLSDHFNRDASRVQKAEYYSKQAEELKQPETKTKQVWRLKEITVNKETYNSYEEALDAIDKRLP